MSDPTATSPTSRRVVGVQFRHAAAVIYDFDAADLALNHDSCVIVETERGEALGWTVGEPEDREPHTEGALRRILRVAGHSDETRRRELARREEEALRFCARSARKRGLPMKVIAVEWAHSGEKAAFYFSSEERIDFRDLVRELAQHFRIRVEMRQVGPRDEAKIIGAMGPCGRETCCSSWMRAFTPVSIKMAKDQGLSITPAKVTGVCGRLLCCLAYEQDTYKDLRRKLPRLGKQVVTAQGPGRIIDVLVLRERVRVALEQGGPPVEFAASEVRPVGAPAPVVEEPDSDAADALDELPAVAPVPPPPATPPAAPPRLGRERRGPPPQQRDDRPPRGEPQRPPRPEGRPNQPPQQARPPRPQSGPPAEGRSREGQKHGDHRPNRPPRPPRQPQPPVPAAASEPAAEARRPEEKSAGGPVRSGPPRRHRHRRGGGPEGGKPPTGGGGAPPAGP